MSDNQDGFCWKIGIYILLLTSSPRDKNSDERSTVQGPSCFYVQTFHYHSLCVQLMHG